MSCMETSTTPSVAPALIVVRGIVDRTSGHVTLTSRGVTGGVEAAQIVRHGTPLPYAAALCGGPFAGRATQMPCQACVERLGVWAEGAWEACPQPLRSLNPHVAIGRATIPLAGGLAAFQQVLTPLPPRTT